ncbi:MAG: hypothetical protein Q4C12_05940 [Clostridia bacterium]|nr:hypothetical protein [Clostridia bacterium]
MRKIINTNIRLNLDDEADKKAWEYLQGMDRKIYKSYTKAVVIALNEHFERQDKIEADPYLETREKEDIFLQKILDTIKQGLTDNAQTFNLSSLLQFVSANQGRQTEAVANTQADDDAALDFADSL